MTGDEEVLVLKHDPRNDVEMWVIINTCNRATYFNFIFISKLFYKILILYYSNNLS